MLSDVRTCIWQPHTPEPVEVVEDPTFHEFATACLASISKQVKPRTVLHYDEQLRIHLLPFFKDRRLSQITASEVDRYREAKLLGALLDPPFRPLLYADPEHWRCSLSRN